MTTETRVKIETRDPADPFQLYHKYAQQSAPQDIYVELDLEDGALRVDWNVEIGNAVPVSVWHGRVRRYAIGAILRTAAANALLEEVAPLAQAVVDGSSVDWDGSNWTARLTQAAEDAEREIESLCSDAGRWDPYDAVIAWSAWEWYASLGGADKVREELRITAATTDRELAAIVERETEFYAVAEGGMLLEDAEEYFTFLRDDAKEEAAP